MSRPLSLSRHPGIARTPHADLPHRIGRVLLAPQRIAARVRALAAQLDRDYPVDPIVMIGILRGSFIFLADLIRALRRRNRCVVIDFMTLESYGNRTRSDGRVRLAKSFSADVRGRRVVLVDDILDTGHTLTYAKRYVLRRGAREVRTCVLLEKPARRTVDATAEYIGFSVPDRFVVGYGLDYAGWYRDLPYIATVRFIRPTKPPQSRVAPPPGDPVEC